MCIHKHVAAKVGIVAYDYVHAHAHAHACRHTHTVSGHTRAHGHSCEGQRSTSSINHSSGHRLFGVLRQGLWVLKLTYFLRLPGQQVLSSSGTTSIHCHSQLFTWVLGDITQVCMFAWQALYQLSLQALILLSVGKSSTACGCHNKNGYT